MPDTKVAEKHFCKDCKHRISTYSYKGLGINVFLYNICRLTLKTDINYGDESKNEETFEKCDVKNATGACKDFEPKPPKPIKISLWKRIMYKIFKNGPPPPKSDWPTW